MISCPSGEQKANHRGVLRRKIARRSLGLSERPAVRVARVLTRYGGHVTLPLPAWNRGRHVLVVLVEGLSTDPSGACSACAVASLIRGKHTDVLLCPDVVCYLNIAWCNPARESFPTAVRETWWHKMPYFRNGLGLNGGVRSCFRARSPFGMERSIARGFV